MNGVLLALWLLGSPARAAKPAPPAAVHEDLNAVRRARYALRKAKPGTPEEAAAKKGLEDAKKKLKDDRLKARQKK